MSINQEDVPEPEESAIKRRIQELLPPPLPLPCGHCTRVETMALSHLSFCFPRLGISVLGPNRAASVTEADRGPLIPSDLHFSKSAAD